jgi:hypothetical protein
MFSLNQHLLYPIVKSDRFRFRHDGGHSDSVGNVSTITNSFQDGSLNTSSPQEVEPFIETTTPKSELRFFDKEGNSLNYIYNEDLGRYEGDIYFHENSSDTFKTQTLFLLENISAFQYENPDLMTLKKFQLFNERGFHFYPGNYVDKKIKRVIPVNNDVTFYSKWVYGDNFDFYFPKGTIIRFDSSLMEFNNPNQSYVVTSAKKDAILIVSLLDNFQFTNLYSGIWDLDSTYIGKSISSINIIGIYDYIDSFTLRDKLSPWNEPSFYDRLYAGRKLNIVNSDKNDNYKNTKDFEEVNVVTLDNNEMIDIVHYEYNTITNKITGDLIIEAISKTDLPLIYKNGLNFNSSNSTLEFGDTIPQILKPGSNFKVQNSVSNTDIFSVSPIQSFKGNVVTTYYQVGNQVMWNNDIYQCINSYTWSATSSITPDDSNYWSNLPTYLPINPSPVNENLLLGDLYLTNNKFYFTQTFTASGIVTAASAVENFKNELKSLDIDFYLNNFSLKADLIYPTNYCEVNFYNGFVGPTTSIGNISLVYERALEVREQLVKEFNYDYSQNYSYNIVITDLDEYGLIVKVNKMVYQTETQFLYSMGQIDMQRTIDKTLRYWLTKSFARLMTLGIIPTLQTIGNNSPYYNSINLRTQFPNVPLQWEVLVGSTADFYVEHTLLTINDMGSFLSIKVNNRSYDIKTIMSSPYIPDIAQTLSDWVEEHQNILESYGIYVVNSASSLDFRVKKQTQRLDLIVNVGKSSLPGINLYQILKRSKGNQGTIITSNEIKLNTDNGDSLEEVGFATGMITGINETIYPLQNQEYNILYLQPETINLSYEGPFWGMTDSLCEQSPFVTVAFSIGYGATGCPTDFLAGTSNAGMFDNTMFSNDFSINYMNTNTYSVNNYNLFALGGADDMVDILYIPNVSSMYILGKDLLVFDALTAQQTTTILLNSGTYSVDMVFNPITNYLYAITKNSLYKIDPYINQIISTYSISGEGYEINYSQNGDIYITTDLGISIFDNTGLVNSLSLPSYHIVSNDFENDMYAVGRDGSSLYRIDGSSRTLQTTYTISGLTNSIVYDPTNESIYVWGSSLYKVMNGQVATASLLTPGGFEDMLFNNLTNTLSLSSDNSTITSLSLEDDSINYTQFNGYWGYQVINQYDGDIYISSQGINQVTVVDNVTGNVKHIVPLIGGLSTRLAYNPLRKSIWTIQPVPKNVVEIEVTLNNYITLNIPDYLNIRENSLGTLDENYKYKKYLWLHTQDYLRRPRMNFNNEPYAKYYWRWFSDNVPQFFMYDFTGNQLPTSGPLSYTGEKPLPTVVLNRKANRDTNKRGISEAQQTIFDQIYETLEHVDDENDVSSVPEPIQLFIGFNSPDEGALRSILQLYLQEDVDFTVTTNNLNLDEIRFETIIDGDDRYGKITLNENSTSNFINDINDLPRGLKIGQHLAIFIKDLTNTKDQYLSKNNGYLLKIREVYNREIIVDFFQDIDELHSESTIINDYPHHGKTTYLSTRFKVWDKEIGRFNVLGQTEIEDIRYRTELGNVGKLINPEDTYIFKDYDIKEDGIDWVYLNAKRKEMLMMKHLIYPYIGSYKSIINAINYFGYNDLVLNEYYRNINPDSPEFLKLFKVEIPDIFDPSVPGWSDKDFLKHTFPNPSFEDTNLFNLTYDITDKEGNNILTYTLEEVQKKLQGLKIWLQKNIIPLTHKILDISGRAYVTSTNHIKHNLHDATVLRIHEKLTPVVGYLREAYLMPVNNGSTVYNCVIDFGTGSTQSLPDTYEINITTYEIYREWYPFKIYDQGNRVIYYDKLYESVIPENRVNNPRKYENTPSWSNSVTYKVADIVEYNREFYVYSGTMSMTSSVSPNVDISNWINVTEWKEIDLVPIQHIKEVRKANNLLPYNFVIDSNIDPFIRVEITSDNGYGSTYTQRRNYDIKGVLDIRELESYTNLTSKQYIRAIIPIVYPEN